MKKLKIAIVGGGASGLIAAVVAKKEHTTVDLYEKNQSIGRKILVSGNGRCNIFNTSVSINDYYGEDISFASKVLKRLDFNRFREFCLNMGLLLDVKEDGRVYPLSDEAKSVVNVFRAYLDKLNVNILTNTPVLEIEKTDAKFTLFNDDGILGEYDKVLIASGSLAAPQLGASKDGANMALSFGHLLNPIYPALVPLELDGTLFRRMEGVKMKALIALYVDNKKKGEVLGDILFTKYGISGFAVLDISSQASFYLKNSRKVEISINLLPGFEKQYIGSRLTFAQKNLKEYDILTVLSGMLPLKVAKAVLIKIGIDAKETVSSFNSKSIKQIVNEMFNMRFEVTATHGFKYAEACGGGVKTDDICVNTMESKLAKGLYFAGEVLDIVGARGGFNFAFAFASGYVAASNMALST